ncbi:hypothetical protein [Dactylosporangium sp. NPDC000521]|uniref:hypothetical protein n=1 Tax=Dactylosporangium sp. NPDC000521 TaxID=3363975 RepID=UPI003674A702
MGSEWGTPSAADTPADPAAGRAADTAAGTAADAWRDTVDDMWRDAAAETRRAAEADSWRGAEAAPKHDGGADGWRDAEAGSWRGAEAAPKHDGGADGWRDAEAGSWRGAEAGVEHDGGADGWRDAEAGSWRGAAAGAEHDGAGRGAGGGEEPGAEEGGDGWQPRSRVGAVVAALLNGDHDAAEQVADEPQEHDKRADKDPEVLAAAIRLAVCSLFDEDTPPDAIADYVAVMARDVEVDQDAAVALIRAQLGHGDEIGAFPEQVVIDTTWSVFGYLCERRLGREDSLELIAQAEAETL